MHFRKAGVSPGRAALFWAQRQAFLPGCIWRALALQQGNRRAAGRLYRCEYRIVYSPAHGRAGVSETPSAAV